MPGKKVQCRNCSAVMRSDNLNRHIKTCKSRQRRPFDQTNYHQEQNDVNGGPSIADSDDDSSMDIGNQSNKRTMIQSHKNSPSVQASYQSDRLRENADHENRKSKISSHTLKQPQRYVPKETFIDRIGSYSLNPSTDTHYIDSGDDDSSMEDQSDECSDESSMEELDKNRISSYALSGPVTQSHCIWFPPSVRAIIVGKSGSGKMTLLSYLLLAPKIMKYNNLIVCGRSLHQPEYKTMQQGFDKGLSNTQVGALFVNRERAKEQSGSLEQFIKDYSLTCKGGVEASFFDDVTKIPDPCEHDASRKNLLVLDDVMLGPQNKVEAYFTRGRHNNVDVI